MNKTERIKTELLPLVNSFLLDGKPKRLENYIVKNSNLPSPRANLELAYALSNILEVFKKKDLLPLFNLFAKWTEFSSKKAPVNDPKEFLPFCGLRAIGRIGALDSKFKTKALNILRDKSRDKRWRVREAVTMGLQFLLNEYPEYVVINFNKWITGKNLYELRAIITTYASPDLLTRKIISQNGLKSHRKIIDIVHESVDRKSDEFKSLRKALGYTFSLIATIYTPNSFGVMKKLVALDDKDLTWIVKENIKKKRLSSNFPKQVKEVEKLINKVQRK